MGVGVEVKDTGAGKVTASLQSLAQSVTFGVHDDAAPYEDGTRVQDVGSGHEFGDGIAPQRSFLRAYVDSGGKAVIADTGAEEIGKVIDGSSSSPDVSKAIGEIAVRGVLDRMARGIADNETGVSRDLDETGHLRDSIDWKPEA